LPKNATSIACSEFCADELRRQCEIFLAALDGDLSGLFYCSDAKM
jgi:hypothetical protein